MLRLSLATSALGLCLSAWAAPQLSPQPVQAPANQGAIASTPVARSLPGESGLAYQWPGAYFELNFGATAPASSSARARPSCA